MIFGFCEKCQDKVMQFGVPAVEIYLKICRAYALTNNPLVIEIGEGTTHLLVAIAYLEMKGFVITYETPEAIIVKPALALQSCGSFLFCNCEKEKSPSQGQGKTTTGEDV